VRPESFALYRDGNLVAGEFGVRSGRVYTSYSGYYDENNAGTVQLILTARYLQERGDAFFDLGMPLDYKTDLGATDISPEEFVKRFRTSQPPRCGGGRGGAKEPEEPASGAPSGILSSN
jgi:Leu/Phe-tRNA-protein transferase